MSGRIPHSLALLSLLALVGCSTGGDAGLLTAPATDPIVVTCELASAEVQAGDLRAVLLTARVTRSGRVLPGTTVTFATTAGTLASDSAVTDATGVATTSLVPPAAPGAIVVSARAGGGAATSECGLRVTGFTSPRLQVFLLAPTQLAGATITVTYNEAVLDIDAGAIARRGALAAADCVGLIAGEGTGVLRVTMGCPTLRAVAGTEALSVDFTSTGPGQDAGDFLVTCAGVDDMGRTVTTTCTHVVTQI